MSTNNDGSLLPEPASTILQVSISARRSDDLPSTKQETFLKALQRNPARRASIRAFRPRKAHCARIRMVYRGQDVGER